MGWDRRRIQPDRPIRPEVRDQSVGAASVPVPRCSAQHATVKLMEDCMRNRLGTTATACGLAIACLASTAGAQTPAPAGQAAPVSSAVAAPTYISIPLEIAVNRPAAEVWRRVGK